MPLFVLQEVNAENDVVLFINTGEDILTQTTKENTNGRTTMKPYYIDTTHGEFLIKEIADTKVKAQLRQAKKYEREAREAIKDIVIPPWTRIKIAEMKLLGFANEDQDPQGIVLGIHLFDEPPDFIRKVVWHELAHCWTYAYHEEECPLMGCIDGPVDIEVLIPVFRNMADEFYEDRELNAPVLF